MSSLSSKSANQPSKPSVNSLIRNSFSVKEIVEKIIDASGKELIITYDLAKPNINTKLALISNLAFEELGWKPSITLEKGIRKTIQWYKENVRGKK